MSFTLITPVISNPVASNPSGQPSAIAGLAGGLREAGHDVRIVALPGTHPCADAVAQNAARSAWAALPAESRVVIDRQALPAFLPIADLLPGRGAILLAHCAAPEPGLAAAEQAMLPLFQWVVVPGEATASRLHGGFNVAPGRLAVIRPGVDRALRSPGSEGPGCQILAAAALVPRNGHDRLIDAMARLLDLDWRLILCGDPANTDYAAALQARAQAPAFNGRIRFAGSAVADAEWRSADLFALAAHPGGDDLAVLQALRRGIPVATLAGGDAEALVPRGGGLVCEAGDLETLSKALRRMIFDTELRASMAEAAWHCGQNLPDWRTQAEHFAALR